MLKAKYTEQFNMRIDSALRKRLRKEAARQDLEQTQLVRRLIIRYLDDQDLKRNAEAKNR
jgi:predicted HicB family RNase H-like nuclease